MECQLLCQFYGEGFTITMNGVEIDFMAVSHTRNRQ